LSLVPCLDDPVKCGVHFDAPLRCLATVRALRHPGSLVRLARNRAGRQPGAPLEVPPHGTCSSSSWSLA
jgi:hypothetical protein